MKRVEKIVILDELLRNRGLKATPARLALLAVLHQAKKPLSITALQRALTKEKINHVTFYRMVEDFMNAGIVRPVDLRHGHAHYELVPDREHHHLICTGCGMVKDITGCLPENFEIKTLRANPDFAKITDHALELFGLCKKCATK